jgi:branched-chain amino acid transport system substrate-binding protein
MNKTAKTILYLIATIIYLVTPFTYAAQKTNCQPDTLVPVKYRQSGSAVRNLQACLIQAGYSIPAGVTGYYGLQTVNAVKKFYADWYGAWSGLSIGPQGIAHLKQVVTKAPTTTTTKEPQPTTPTTKEPIKIGAILPLSGKNATYGNEIKNAIDLAIEEINNSGGINGRKIEVIYEDDQADPKVGVNAMQKLVNIDKVPVVLGSWVSGVVVASAPIAEKAKVIVMAEAIAPSITNAGDYIFRIQPSATYYSDKLMEVVINKLGLKKIAIIYINNEFGVALRDTLRSATQRLGGQIVAEESYMPGDSDFRSQLTKIKSAKPEALFIGGYQEQINIIKQANELGLKTQFLAGPPFESQTTIQSLGNLAEGVIYPYHFAVEKANPKTISYMEAYKKKFGVETGGFAPLMYDAVYIIANAMKKCETNTDCIKTELYNTNYNGVSGNITFDKNGDPIIPIIIKTVKNGKFVPYEK